MDIYQLKSNKTYEKFKLVAWFGSFKGEACGILEREDGSLTHGTIKYLRTKLPEGAKMFEPAKVLVAKEPEVTKPTVGAKALPKPKPGKEMDPVKTEPTPPAELSEDANEPK